MQKLVFIAALTLSLPVIAWAQETPRTEIFSGYSYLRLDDSGVPNQDRDLNGYIVSTNTTLYKFIGIKTEVSGHFGDFQTNVFPQTDQGQTLFLAGPVFTLRKFERIQPFAHALFGVDRLRLDNSALGLSQTTYKFAFAAGGGVDLMTPLGNKLAVRLFQADYLLTRFTGSNASNLRASTGIVVRLGHVDSK
ncbi:MAG: hypothetical protein J2P21_01040 [Chloracidobacterium sp.]|nr:hypothetical protein [Chloracidobacterium sp.]